jgi:hypothetical protein
VRTLTARDGIEGAPRTNAQRDRVAWRILEAIPERTRPERSAKAWAPDPEGSVVDTSDPVPADVHDKEPESTQHDDDPGAKAH